MRTEYIRPNDVRNMQYLLENLPHTVVHLERLHHQLHLQVQVSTLPRSLPYHQLNNILGQILNTIQLGMNSTCLQLKSSFRRSVR
jgi:hypothetical protein